MTFLAEVVNTKPSLHSMLQPLLHEDALFPLFQPIVDLRQGTVFGHEALIRGPLGTSLHSPLAMLSLAAAESRLVEFELHCVDVILRHWGKLKNAERLFLNMSADALVSAMEGERPGWFERTLANHEVRAQSVVVEVTEQQGMVDIHGMLRAVKSLHALGAVVALDDLGESHSGLRRWTELEPDVVKIDMFFTQGISTNPRKLEFVRAIASLGETLGTVLVAEGVEDAEDLRILRDLGIGYGQGYLLGRPVGHLVPSIESAVTEALRDKQIAVMPQANSQAGRSVLQSIAFIHATPVTPETLNNEVSVLFQASPEIHALPVLRDGRPIALINRQSFMNDYARLYFREVHGRRPCLHYANRSPRVLRLDDNVENLIGILMSDDQRYLSDGFIVTDHDEYVGLGTGEQLVRAVTEARVEAARHANPLTFLPGNIPISIHTERLLAGGASFVACYADLNNFKAFNDHYGYWRGDEMIRTFARLAVLHVDPHRDFVGHIGGDDFLVLFQSPDWEQRCALLMQEFAAEALTMYDSAAREAGGIEEADRHGVIRFFPCTTVSIGAVCVDPGLYQRAQDVANEATLAKQGAKTAASGFVVRQALAPAAQASNMNPVHRRRESDRH